MNFTTATVASSLASYLAAFLPGVVFYPGPNQQGTQTPCMFLQQRYSYITLQPGGRWIRKIGLDLTYLVDYNLPNLQELYLAAAEALDLAMETFPYTDGGERALLRTHDRQWTIDLDALHCKFELRIRVSQPERENPMESISYHPEVTNG